MSDLVTTIEIECPPQEVFSYLTDPTRFAEWQRDVREVRVSGAGTPDMGARFTTTRRIGRSDRTMTQQVTENQPSRRWAVAGIDGPIRPRASITVEPLDDGTRSRVTFALGFEGHGIGVALVPMVRRMAARGAPSSYHNVKRLLEAGKTRTDR